MAGSHYERAFYTAHPRASGPVVRRSWKLQLEAGRPLLTGLYGFPWREQSQQAKCTVTAAAGPAELFGTVRLDRQHRSVPSPDCSCGIYATDDPRSGWLQRRYLRDSVLVNGFVQLSGRVMQEGPVYRAEEARIVGPLTISLPGRRRLRRLGARMGVGQRIMRVMADGDSFLMRYSTGRRGVSVGEWLMQTGAALSRRYGVEVVGIIPPVAGLDRQ